MVAPRTHQGGDDVRFGAEDAGAASAATLLLLGCVGLIVHSHEAVPELAALAALCGAFAALPHAILLEMFTREGVGTDGNVGAVTDGDLTAERYVANPVTGDPADRGGCP